MRLTKTFIYLYKKNRITKLPRFFHFQYIFALNHGVILFLLDIVEFKALKNPNLPAE